MSPVGRYYSAIFNGQLPVVVPTRSEDEMKEGAAAIAYQFTAGSQARQLAFSQFKKDRAVAAILATMATVRQINNENSDMFAAIR